MDVISEMLRQIATLEKVATDAFKNTREKREAIKSELCAALLETTKLQTLHNELISAEIEGMAENIKRYSNFKGIKEVEYTILEDAPYHSTICMVHADKVCHDRCNLQFTESVGADTFSRCACMHGRTVCVVCECGHEKHFHAMKTLTKMRKTVEEILGGVKAQYDLCVGRKAFLKAKISTLKADLQSVKRALAGMEGTIADCCKQLKGICSRFNFVAELKAVIDVMEASASTVTSMEARSEADRMVENMKVLVDDLTYRKNR